LDKQTISAQNPFGRKRGTLKLPAAKRKEKIQEKEDKQMTATWVLKPQPTRGRGYPNEIDSSEESTCTSSGLGQNQAVKKAERSQATLSSFSTRNRKGGKKKP